MRVDWEDIHQTIMSIESDLKDVAGLLGNEDESEEFRSNYLLFKSAELNRAIRRLKQLLNPPWPHSEDPHKVIFMSVDSVMLLLQFEPTERWTWEMCHTVCQHLHPSRISIIQGVWPDACDHGGQQAPDEECISWEGDKSIIKVPEGCFEPIHTVLFNLWRITGLGPDPFEENELQPVVDELNNKHAKAFKYIQEHQPVFASAISNYCEIKESTFRTHWLPKLRKAGVKSTGDGYVIETDDFF